MSAGLVAAGGFASAKSIPPTLDVDPFCALCGRSVTVSGRADDRKGEAA